MQLVQADKSEINGFINFGNPSILNNVRPCTTIVCAKPAAGGGQNGAGYLDGKSAAGADGGYRHFINHNSNNPQYAIGGDSTGTNLAPARTGVGGSAVYGAWQYFAMTDAGGLSGSTTFRLYRATDGGTFTEVSYFSATDGTTAREDDSTHDLILMNRVDLVRALLAGFAWYAKYDFVMDTTQLNQAIQHGPRTFYSNLLVCYANEQDVGPNALTIEARSTYVPFESSPGVPDLPVYTDLGGVEGTMAATEAGDVFSAVGNYTAPDSFIGTLELTETGDTFAGAGVRYHVGTSAVTEVGDTFTATGISGNNPVLVYNFARSCIDIARSSVTQVGDQVRVNFFNVYQESEAAGGDDRHLGFYFAIDNVLNKSLRVILNEMGTNDYHGATWQTASGGRRIVLSYTPLDFDSWFLNNTAPVLSAGNTVVTLDHSELCTQNRIYVAWTIPISDDQIIAELEDIRASYPTRLHYPAGFDSFVVDTFPTQTGPMGSYGGPQIEYRLFDNAYQPTGHAKCEQMWESGMHGWEDQGIWTHLKMVRRVCEAGDAAAINHLTNSVIYGWPRANPYAAIGAWRGQFTQGSLGEDDGNRHYKAVGSGPIVLVSKNRERQRTVLGNRVALLASIHGDYGAHGLSKLYAAYLGTTYSALLSDVQTRVGGSSAFHDYGNSTVDSVAEWGEVEFAAEGHAPAASITWELGFPIPFTVSTAYDVFADCIVDTHAALLTSGVQYPQEGVTLIQEAGDTFAASGARVHDATMEVFEGLDTFAGTGARLHDGTMGITEQGDFFRAYDVLPVSEGQARLALKLGIGL